MKEIRERDLPAISEGAFQRAKALSWESIAESTLSAYQHQPRTSN
jgi:hypothetical protein